MALLAGGDAPVGFGRGVRDLEIQWSKENLLAVADWAMQGSTGDTMASFSSPALMAVAEREMEGECMCLGVGCLLQCR